MMQRTLDSAALEVLRALFDLAEADLRPTLDLLGRLLGLDTRACSALIAQLRVAQLLQADRLCLTMAGLVVAASLPVTEPRPMTAPAGRGSLRAA
jgi:hypothetical protein